jgi:hypothetical protein
MKLLLTLVAISSAAAAQAAQKSAPTPECGDFLKQFGMERPDVIFFGCERHLERNPDADRPDATYRVAGKDLAHVEAWLMRAFHAKPLRFVCCGWETPTVWFKARDGAYYEIGFGGETAFNRRKDWPKVPYLTLSVTRDIEEP